MSGFWRHKRSRQLAIGIGAAVAAVVVISAFALVWRMTAPRRAAEQAPPPIEEAESTTESAEPSQTAIAALPTSSSAEPTRSTTSTTPATSPATPVTSGALIAYRLGPNLYVADENGRNPNAVALAPSGDFTLSPDGRTIAVVDGDSKQLVFLDIGTRTLVESGIVSGGRPVWMPDSSGVLLPTMADVNGATRIQRFSRQGGSPIAVAMGGIAAVSPDAGTTVVGPGPASSGDETSRIAIIRAGKTTVVKAPGLVTAVACSNEKVYVGTMGDQGAGVWTVPVTGGKPSPFLPVAQGSPYVMLGLSPDAACIAFATGGDDGYSRVSVIPSQGGTPVKLWVRRDDYLLQWSADSTWVYLIEGNAFQGESTSLYRVGRNGHGRRLLVQDAGL